MRKTDIWLQKNPRYTEDIYSCRYLSLIRNGETLGSDFGTAINQVFPHSCVIPGDLKDVEPGIIGRLEVIHLGIPGYCVGGAFLQLYSPIDILPYRHPPY